MQSFTDKLLMGYGMDKDLIFWLRRFALGYCILLLLLTQSCSSYYDNKNPSGNPPINTPAQATATLDKADETATQTITSPTTTNVVDENNMTSTVPTSSPIVNPTGEPVETIAGEENIFSLQEGSPSYLPNTFHQELGCGWIGIAGQLFDLYGVPIRGLIIEVEGELGGKFLIELGITGGAPQYGSGGYEIVLGERPQETLQAMVLRVMDLDGKQLSADIKFDTYASCEKNLIIINFLAHEFFNSQFYLPLIRK